MIEANYILPMIKWIMDKTDKTQRKKKQKNKKAKQYETSKW